MTPRASPPIRWLIVLGLVLGFLGSGAVHLALESHGPEDLNAGGSPDCAVCQVSHHALGEAPQEPPTTALLPAQGTAPSPIDEPAPAVACLPAAPRGPPVLS